MDLDSFMTIYGTFRRGAGPLWDSVRPFCAGPPTLAAGLGIFADVELQAKIESSSLLVAIRHLLHCWGVLRPPVLYAIWLDSIRRTSAVNVTQNTNFLGITPNGMEGDNIAEATFNRACDKLPRSDARPETPDPFLSREALLISCALATAGGSTFSGGLITRAPLARTRYRND
ncbi:hypothetical protein ACJJTC_015640 [Scirpophaga incertulas]